LYANKPTAEDWEKIGQKIFRSIMKVKHEINIMYFIFSDYGFIFSS